MFVLLYILSFFLIVNSDDWFIMWLGLELNMLSFIMLIYKRKKCNNIESCLKYFFIQAVGSGLLLGMMMFGPLDFSFTGLFVLMYKMGAGIFYFWFPPVCMGLGWFSCFFLMTVQKFIPFMLVSVFFFVSWFMWFTVMYSLLIGVLGSFNQKQMKRLLAYSSIYHIGWLFICYIVDGSLWLFYLIVYTFVLFPVISFLGFFSVSDLMMINKWDNKWLFVFGMLSLGGIPPFLGFFLKWMTFYWMLKFGWGMVFFMILMSMLMLYIYIRVMYELLLGTSTKMAWGYKNTKLVTNIKLDLLILVGLMLGTLVGVYMVIL